MNKQQPGTFKLYIPVKNLKAFKNSLYSTIVLCMHETLNLHTEQTIYPAVAALPGNELFHLLRKKRNSPLLFPAFI